MKLTEEQHRENFLKHIKMLKDYWLNESTRAETTEDKVNGLIFSILVAIDGEAINCPGFKMIPLNDNNIDISGNLHNKWYDSINNETFKKWKDDLVNKKPREVKSSCGIALTIGVNMIPTKYSSSISSMGYDLKNKHLIIKYRNNGTYIYKNVEVYKFISLQKEKNKGKFLREKISTNHDYIKV